MKKNTTYFGLGISAVAAMFIMQSCTKELPVNIAFEPYVYSSFDPTGGTWQPIFITGPGVVTIPAPADVASAEYQAELESVKNFNGALTGDQQSAVDYWGNNSLIRWVEIASELASKYNLPPSPNADGTYGVPNSTTPGVYPYFPFAHPPYTARMYAYLTAANYDALITAWNYKYMYNRPAPYINDASIKPAYPDNSLPSYPSEDAVIASVSQDILTFMFPLEAEYIASKADELRNSRLWAGMNVQSDITAGDSIGHAIAGIFIGRAKTDSMKYAQVTATDYAAFETNADVVSGGQWPHWENLEDPQRPVGITPKFGRVIPWWIPSVETVRPGPPPAVGSAEYNAAVEELKSYANNLTPDQERLAFFWGDGAGTYTPTGHWNFIANDYIVQHKYNPLHTARVLAYLNTAMEDAGISCWDTKYYYMYPRPPQADGDIKTLFMLPNFPSYTSGHSTFSGAARTVLSYLFPDDAAAISQFAIDASNSRIYARIHFRFDCETGLNVGDNIGTYAVTAAQADGSDSGN